MGITTKHTFFVLLFLSLVSQGFAQKFEGKIVADSISFTQVNIVNLTQKLGTVNAKSGEFSIDAKIGDEVMFSSVQYEPYQVTISKELLQQKNNTIFLFNLVNELDEVNISNIDLSGDLTKDADNIETNAYFNPADHGLPVNSKPKPTTAQRRIYTASTGSGIIPIDPIINTLSGRMAMLYRQRDYEKERNLMIKAYNSRPLDYFVTELKLPEEYVEDFLYYCTEFKLFRNLVVKKENNFKLSEFFEEKVIDYKNLKNLP